MELAIKANVLSDYVKANGMGGIEKSRFDAAIQQLAETYEYKNKPDAKLYYTDAYLPAGGVKWSTFQSYGCSLNEGLHLRIDCIMASERNTDFIKLTAFHIHSRRLLVISRSWII